MRATYGGRDALYVIDLYESGGFFNVVVYFGRNGSALTPSTKSKVMLSPRGAQELAEATEQEKRKKGYMDYVGPRTVVGLPVDAAELTSAALFQVTHVGARSPVASSIAAEAKAPVARERAKLPLKYLPMLARPIEEDAFMLELPHQGMALQQKFDGTRVLVKIVGSNSGGFIAQGFNRSGEEISLPSAVDIFLHMHLSMLTDPGDEDVLTFQPGLASILDGELMGDTYRVFDILSFNGDSVTELSFLDRYGILEAALAPRYREPSNRAHELLARTEFKAKYKTAMLAQAKVENWEGVILRNISMHYASALRGLAVQKLKFWDSCTCTVLEINAKRSIQLGLLGASGTLENVGNCTVPVNQIIPEVGQLVEVRYLYAYEGGSLVQPTLLCVRHDVPVDLRSSLRNVPPEKLAA